MYQEEDAYITEKKKDKCQKAIEEANKVYNLIKETKMAYTNPKSSQAARPLPYRKIKTNRLVAPVKLENLEDSENQEICKCTASDPNPCGQDSNCLNVHLKTECSSICPAGERCQNQRFEKRIYSNVKVTLTESKGWGLVALEDIAANTFIIEYVGEVINGEEFDKRFKRMKQNKEELFYFLELEQNLYIDAGPCGNEARFINHSCDPNCFPERWTINGHTRIGLFSLVDIPKV